MPSAAVKRQTSKTSGERRPVAGVRLSGTDWLPARRSGAAMAWSPAVSLVLMRHGLVALLVVAIVAACGSATPELVVRPAPDLELAGRAAHTATPLAGGSVLVAGGCDV